MRINRTHGLSQSYPSVVKITFYFNPSNIVHDVWLSSSSTPTRFFSCFHLFLILPLPSCSSYSLSLLLLLPICSFPLFLFLSLPSLSFYANFSFSSFPRFSLSYPPYTYPARHPVVIHRVSRAQADHISALVSPL